MYKELLDEAPRGSRDARYIHTKIAELASDRKDYDAALEHYERAWRGHSDEIAASARYEAAELHATVLDAPQAAVDGWFRLLETCPDSANAEMAAERLSDYFRRRGAPETFAKRATDVHARIADHLAADNLLFWVAKCFAGKNRRADEDAAVEWYRRLLEKHPDSSTADDAHWELANIFSAQQSWSNALAHYGAVAEMYRPSWFVGSYSSPYASSARYRLGMIHLLFTDNYGAAESHFRKYLADFPTLRYADESAWHLVQLARLRGEEATYQRRLRRFIDDYPKSRYVRRAKSQLVSNSTRRRHSARD